MRAAARRARDARPWARIVHGLQRMGRERSERAAGGEGWRQAGGLSLFGRYLLWQVPGWLAAALIAAWLVRGFGLPIWAGLAVVALVVARDLAIYPALRSAFGKPPHAPTPIGATAEAVEPLDPLGYVRVNGELWRARTVHPADEVVPGARVRVRDARGLTLFVEPSGAGRRSASE